MTAPGIFAPQDDAAPAWYTPQQKKIHEKSQKRWDWLHGKYVDIIESLPKTESEK